MDLEWFASQILCSRGGRGLGGSYVFHRSLGLISGQYRPVIYHVSGRCIGVDGGRLCFVFLYASCFIVTTRLLGIWKWVKIK